MLAVALVAACSTTDLPTDPSSATPPVPQLAIATFGVTTIGQPEEGIRPSDINDQGLVLGILAPPGGAVWRVFQWSNGGIQVLPATSPNGAIGFAQNAFGLAVGVDGGEAVAWENGTRTVLVDPDAGGRAVVAAGVNPAGQIVGYRELSGILKRTGLVWTGKTDQHPASLATLQGLDATPSDINGAGTIVGAVNGAGAVAWSDKLAEPKLLPDPDGHGDCDDDGTASEINERGEIVGFCGPSNQPRGAYWATKDAQPVALGNALVTGINDLGQIVGTLDDRPTLWNREAGQLRAYDLGSASSLPGLIRVTAVNNTGQVVGMHFTSTGPIAMVWRIPIRVDLDLVPGSSANALRMKGGGSVGAVILGSRWFRAADVDPATLTLGNDDGVDAPSLADKRGRFPLPSDVNRDGFPDLTIQFDKAALIRNGDIAVGDRTLVLLGRTKDGKPVRGTDVVHVGP
jgi:hypothetical protein